MLALGGGSLCDLGGFVAACFLRGIEVAQVPSTLLAQVDASVGGKTAIDLPEGKNTVGAFHQPALVIADTELLATLERAELAAGLVEVIKMAALLDVELLARVERDLDRLLAGDAEALAPVVVGAVAAKIRVVEEDPLEVDRRRLLNFGHTLGHALEAALGYTGLRHGEAVAHGMRFALRLARRRGLEREAADRLERVLSRLRLPPLPAVQAGPLLDAMRRDKKARESGLVWVLPSALGRGEMVSDVTLERGGDGAARLSGGGELSREAAERRILEDQSKYAYTAQGCCGQAERSGGGRACPNACLASGTCGSGTSSWSFS